VKAGRLRDVALALSFVFGAPIVACQAAAVAQASTIASRVAPITARASTNAAQPPPARGAPSSTPSQPGPAPKSAKPTLRTRLTALPSSSVGDGTAPLRVRLSGVPAPGSPTPLLSPRVAGAWKAIGDTESFRPASTLEPCSTYTLTVWAATTATGERPLGRRRTLRLNVACPSLRGLQQALARLRYLPYTIDAPHGRNSGGRRESRALAARYAYHPPSARLRADVPEAPGLRYGTLDPTTRGALMVFQGSHGHAPTGTPDRSTWISLLASETLGHGDPSPYTFVTVSEAIPERLEVHRGRHIAISSPTNTGVPGAITQRGTFPIYVRYTSTTMSGTNPDGTHYSDPGVPWVNYFNGGDAVHGFPRPSYGTPQSNGCVELPIETAARVYPLLAIGDLVIVN
jgi:L,D-transpeptidase catalytic domain